MYKEREMYRRTPIVLNLRDENEEIHHKFSRDKKYLKISDTEKIDLHDLNDRIKRMKPYSNTKISDLPAAISEDHSYLVNTINVIENIPETYNSFFDIITKNFSSTQPDTLGAFYSDCKSDNPCSLACASSIPKPNIVPCKLNVLKGIVKGNSIGFSIVKNNISETDNTLLYIPANVPFNGFTKESINSLKTSGIKNVRVIKYTGNNEVDFNVKSLDGFVPIDTLSIPENEKKEIVQPATPESESFITKNWVIILIAIIVVLLIVGLLLYGFNRTYKQGYSTY